MSEIIQVARIAAGQYERGEITIEQLTEIYRKCTRAAAKSSGHTQQLGLPFPEMP